MIADFVEKIYVVHLSYTSFPQHVECNLFNIPVGPFFTCLKIYLNITKMKLTIINCT